MTRPDDIEGVEDDDRLLDAIAAGAEPGPHADAASALLADIVAAVDAEHPGGATGPGGGGSRRAVWGITLGVAVLVAAGGGLSAAAHTGAPAPAQSITASARGPLVDGGSPPSARLDPSAPGAAGRDDGVSGATGTEGAADAGAAGPGAGTRWRTLPPRQSAAVASGPPAASSWSEPAVWQRAPRIGDAADPASLRLAADVPATAPTASPTPDRSAAPTAPAPTAEPARHGAAAHHPPGSPRPGMTSGGAGGTGARSAQPAAGGRAGTAATTPHQVPPQSHAPLPSRRASTPPTARIPEFSYGAEPHRR